mmetsp:Transcript_149433/g.461303  ORF Transcript_149433/g.461303 Transcript_149433/m.461303 type:complete len:347 (+) Transcript_149433:234-1274(+)
MPRQARSGASKRQGPAHSPAAASSTKTKPPSSRARPVPAWSATPAQRRGPRTGRGSAPATSHAPAAEASSATSCPSRTARPLKPPLPSSAAPSSAKELGPGAVLEDAAEEGVHTPASQCSASSGQRGRGKAPPAPAATSAGPRRSRSFSSSSSPPGAKATAATSPPPHAAKGPSHEPLAARAKARTPSASARSRPSALQLSAEGAYQGLGGNSGSLERALATATAAGSGESHGKRAWPKKALSSAAANCTPEGFLSPCLFKWGSMQTVATTAVSHEAQTKPALARKKLWAVLPMLDRELYPLVRNWLSKPSIVLPSMLPPYWASCSASSAVHASTGASKISAASAE